MLFPIGYVWWYLEGKASWKYRGRIIYFYLIVRLKLFSGVDAINRSMEKPLFMFLESSVICHHHLFAAVSQPQPFIVLDCSMSHHSLFDVILGLAL